MRMKVLNWYLVEDQRLGKMLVQYYGREEGFECDICGHGNNAYCFNRYYDDNGGYETFCYGKEHLPRILKDLGGNNFIVDNEENIEKYLK